MLNIKNGKNLIWNVLGFLIVILFILAIYFATLISRLGDVTEDLNKIEYLNSSTQRIVRLALYDSRDEKFLYYLDTSMNESLNFQSSSKLSVMEEANISILTSDILESWNNIKDNFDSQVLDEFSLINNADNHFYKMSDLSNLITNICDEITTSILYAEIALLTLITLIGAVVINNILQTKAELKQSKVLAEIASLDVATGLYNRSKCQELFKTSGGIKTKQNPAVIVIDLNDLKKTNDMQGHRIGDELIHSFATLLKASCEVHIAKPFTGRYGGDEFIVFYEDVESSQEVEVFLKELKFLTDDFNGRESRFQISYASGYAVNEKNEETVLSIRQLFDKADEEMYINKRIIKQSQVSENSDNINEKLELSAREV
ncbi:MAG: GGDEF domain-containing protein [Clostridia bacterium]